MDAEFGGIIFLHRIVEGGASQYYGIHVVRLACIPPKVIQRSREVLDELQQTIVRESHSAKLTKEKTKQESQLPLFHNASDDVLSDLRKLDPNHLTLLQAPEKLQQWKSTLDSKDRAAVFSGRGLTRFCRTLSPNAHFTPIPLSAVEVI